ncbi:helix-turn-helix domain-containing protein [uncultured Roseibium sp.]|uniref:helix-turn-helix domain-containing protein n=1 Tax=uncultured Roseibium sp. TaxID=1936171 RepID=UPI0032171FA5
MKAKDTLIGVGLYSFAEAARLLGINPSKLNRWLKGYNFKGISYQPLWDAEVVLDDGDKFLGFRDLIELKVAIEFVKLGVSANKIRRAIELSRELFQESYPLTADKFKTDGKNIFIKIMEENDGGKIEERIINTFKRQYEFSRIIDRSLQWVDFDENRIPTQWWPLGKNKNILVDPGRAFGQPIEKESGVPTAILAQAANDVGIKSAAEIYDVSNEAIKRALEFEKNLDEKIAA